VVCAELDNQDFGDIAGSYVWQIKAFSWKWLKLCWHMPLKMFTFLTSNDSYFSRKKGGGWH